MKHRIHEFILTTAVLLTFVPVTESSRILRAVVPLTPWNDQVGQPVVWRPTDYATKTAGHKTMYLVDVGLGSPKQTFRLLVDTGSSALVVPGTACRSRNCTSHQCFNSSRSNHTNRTVFIQYGYGSMKGRIVNDKVCLQIPTDVGKQATFLTAVGLLQRTANRTNATANRTNASGQVPGDQKLVAQAGISSSSDLCTQMSFIVADQESDDFAKLSIDGILGLGLRDPMMKSGNSFSLFEQLAGAGLIQSSSFALRLGSTGDSQLLLGGADNNSIAGGQTLWAPLTNGSKPHWQFSVLDLTLGGVPQNFGGLEVVVDSGTSLFAADNGLRKWLVDKLSPKDCTSVDNMPVLGFQLHGGHVLPFLPSDYVDQAQGSDGLPECKLALMPGGFQSVNGQRLILGDSFLRRFITTFDQHGDRVGFSVDATNDLAHVMMPMMFPSYRIFNDAGDAGFAQTQPANRAKDGVASQASRSRVKHRRLRRHLSRHSSHTTEMDRIAKQFDAS